MDWLWTGFMVIAGIVDTGVVIAVSTFRYVFQGPLAYEWDWRTQISRDMLVYWFQHPEDTRRVKLATKAILQLIESLPWSIYYTRTEHQVPATTVDQKHLSNSGKWAEKLQTATPYSLVLDQVTYTKNEYKGQSVILYLHGGAYISGSRYENLPLALRLSKYTGMSVFMLNYRLAPETKYPGQLYDAYCAFYYLVDKKGYAVSDIILAGDSAGGNLVLALWQLTRAPVSGLLLLSPRVNIVSESRSWQTNLKYDIIPLYDIENPRGSLALLLEPEDRQLKDAFLAPIHAIMDNVPPMLVQAGSREVMVDDIREFVRRVRAQQGNNRNVVYGEYEGGFHVFQSSPFGAVGSTQAWMQVREFAQSLIQPHTPLSSLT